jgi:hypothetical protein
LERSQSDIIARSRRLRHQGRWQAILTDGLGQIFLASHVGVLCPAKPQLKGFDAIARRG